MTKRFQSGFLSSTNLVRWIINLLLLPAATASGMARAPGVTPNREKATIALDLTVREVPASGLASK